MALSSLDVINTMIGLVGEAPVNNLEDFHPLIPAAKAMLDEVNATVQSDAWWFNVEYPTLQPQADQTILLPNDTASVDSLTHVPRLAARGNRLYNLDDVTDKFTCPLQVRLHRILPFDSCPVIARAYIAASARLDYQTAYDGDPDKIRSLSQKMTLAYARMNAEHIRNDKANMFRRSGVAAIIQSMQPYPQGYRRLMR